MPHFNPTPLHHFSDKTPNKMARRGQDDSKEEGEAYAQAPLLPIADRHSSDVPGSPHSLGSSAMDESISDAEDNALNATTIEREMALAEAAEKENEKKKMAQLKQLFPHATGQELSGLTKQTTPRKSIRPRTKQDEALEELKSIREANKREEQLRKEGRLPLPLPRRSPTLSRYELEERKAPSPPPDLPGSFQEFQRVRVSRSNFGEVCFYPGFADAITGCFTRVVFNQDPVTGENMYRMVRIAGMLLVNVTASLTVQASLRASRTCSRTSTTVLT
jgi:RNA polymerase-associated protein RTF1